MSWNEILIGKPDAFPELHRKKPLAPKGVRGFFQAAGGEKRAIPGSTIWRKRERLEYSGEGSGEVRAEYRRRELMEGG